MPRKLSTLLSSLLLGALILLWTLPITDAQESPDITATPEDATAIPEDKPLVVGLPFGDTFDSSLGWTATGAWALDTETAYSGAGWHLDGSQRETVSTLEYLPLLDLSGALTAQLVYRQKGDLPNSDLLAVDLSLDGGHNWIAIDQQIGLDTDWEQHFVDLTDYRGQVVHLRFRVNSGVQISEDEPVTGGYWVDNLSIQFVATAEVMAFTPVDVGPRTLMGLHLIVGASNFPVIDLVKRLRAIGWPLGTLKGTTGTEDILNQVAAISPETLIFYRSLHTPEGDVDCPNVYNDPVTEAGLWIIGLQTYWRGVQADYYEIMNECHPPAEWLVPFAIEAMRVANTMGECLLLFSFGPGNPEPAEFAKLIPVYDFALQNPCQPGRYHAIALHTYGMGNTLVSESGIYLGFRHRLFYTQILSQLPSAIQIPVFLTEAGAGDGRTPFKCEDITRDVIQYTQQLQFDPYVRGFNLWNVGPAGGNWPDVTPCLPMIGDALINYYSAWGQPH
jgi:hypothetical protein